MKQKIEQLFSDIFFDLDLTDEQAKILHKHEQELLKEVEKQALNIPVVSQRSELLSQYNAFLNIQYPTIFKLDDDDINDFNYWLNCG